MHVSLSKANGGVWQPNQIDKEYDRLKGLGAPYARPYIYIYFTKCIFRSFLNIFVNTFRRFSPPTKRFVSVEGRTIGLDSVLRACITERLKFSSRLETSQPETNCRSYSLSQATEKTFGFLDNASKINVIFGYLVFDFSKLIFSE